jgi:hypothetical protein
LLSKGKHIRTVEEVISCIEPERIAGVCSMFQDGEVHVYFVNKGSSPSLILHWIEKGYMERSRDWLSLKSIQRKICLLLTQFHSLKPDRC